MKVLITALAAIFTVLIVLAMTSAVADLQTTGETLGGNIAVFWGNATVLWVVLGGFVAVVAAVGLFLAIIGR